MKSTPITTSSVTSTVTVTSAQLTLPTTATAHVFVSNTACWITQGANPTAVAGAAANMFVPPNTFVNVRSALGVKLAVIRDAADGKCSLTPASVI